MMSFGSKYKWNIVKSINAKENIKGCELRRTHYETILQSMTLGYMNDWVKCDIFDEPNDKNRNTVCTPCFPRTLSPATKTAALITALLNNCWSVSSSDCFTFRSMTVRWNLVLLYLLSPFPLSRKNINFISYSISPLLSFSFFPFLLSFSPSLLFPINFIWWLQTYICNLLDWNESHTRAQYCWKNRELAMLYHRMQSEKNSFITVLEF